MRLHVYGITGWLGAENRPKPERNMAMQNIGINEGEWDRRSLLMPTFIRQMLNEDQDKTLSQYLPHREYAADQAAYHELEILMPTGMER